MLRRMRMTPLFVSAILCAAACAGQDAVKATQNHTAQAILALQQADFSAAYAHASDALSGDSTSSTAAAVRALARYVKIAEALRTQLEAAESAQGIDLPVMRKALAKALRALSSVNQDLKMAAKDKAFALELCLACWDRDWNQNGSIDAGDRNLFQIEIDANGNEIPKDDPRRKPTFRFDVGDIHWARAMVSFQRAVLELALAYRWDELKKWSLFGPSPRITIALTNPKRVHRAKRRILKGLKFARRARKAYLKETDDDREWVPNPSQKSHPLPLPVDAAVYRTWKKILRDLKQLAKGKTGISAAELAQMVDHKWQDPPRGFIDIGKMLREPKSIVLDFPALEKHGDADDGLSHAHLGMILGDYYVAKMKPSKLVRRLARMKKEIDRDKDALERKFRYLLWLN